MYESSLAPTDKQVENLQERSAIFAAQFYGLTVDNFGNAFFIEKELQAAWLFCLEEH